MKDSFSKRVYGTKSAVCLLSDNINGGRACPRRHGLNRPRFETL